MTTKGSPIVPIRIRPDLLAKIDQAVKRANAARHQRYVYRWRRECSRSSWIIKAILERLAHIQRSNRKRPRKVALAVAGGELLDRGECHEDG